MDASQIVAHEADDPNAFVDFLDAEPLTGHHGGDIDLLSMHADPPARGDEDIAVVEGIFDLRQPVIGF